MRPGCAVLPVVFSFLYFAFNCAYVKVNGVVVYKNLDFKEWSSYGWCVLGVC